MLIAVLQNLFKFPIWQNLKFSAFLRIWLFRIAIYINSKSFIILNRPHIDLILFPTDQYLALGHIKKLVGNRPRPPLNNDPLWISFYFLFLKIISFTLIIIEKNNVLSWCGHLYCVLSKFRLISYPEHGFAWMRLLFLIKIFI